MASDFVSIARFNNPAVAERAKARLMAEGISALLTEREKVALRWHSAEQSEADVHLLVALADEDRAVEILNTDAPPARPPVGESQDTDAIATQALLNSSTPAEHDEPTPDLVTNRDALVDRAFKAQVISFLFWPLQLYALYCIFDVSRLRQPLTVQSRRRYTATLILHGVCWAFVAVILFMTGILRSRR